MPLIQAGISTTEGAHWEKQRSFLHSHLVSLVQGKRQAAFQDLVMDEVHDIKMELAKKVRKKREGCADRWGQSVSGEAFFSNPSPFHVTLPPCCPEREVLQD